MVQYIFVEELILKFQSTIFKFDLFPAKLSRCIECFKKQVQESTLPILEEILFFSISQLLKRARITGVEEVKTFSVLLFLQYFSFVCRYYIQLFFNS